MPTRLTDGAGAHAPASFFAPAPRASVEEVLTAIEHCSTHPMLSTILQTFGGVLAVLNAQRQILAVNGAALEMIGVEDAGEVLGLRPGEALDCLHHEDHPGGCGTSRACASCGAAIALVACRTQGSPQEAECTLTLERGGETQDVLLRVRVSPLRLGGLDLMLLFLDDITAERRRAALERAFYHDVNNTMVGLRGALDLMETASPAEIDNLREMVQRYAERLTREIQLQQALSSAQPTAARATPRECSVAALIDEVVRVAGHHRSSRQRTLEVTPVDPAERINTDPVMVHRVLSNMVLNALEAAEEGGLVRIGAEARADEVVFQVWNPEVIPATIQPRIFQRYFSTKTGAGRGTGTFAMRLLGEDYLRGKVEFTSTPEAGTTFRLRLPRLLAPR